MRTPAYFAIPQRKYTPSTYNTGALCSNVCACDCTCVRTYMCTIHTCTVHVHETTPIYVLIAMAAPSSKGEEEGAARHDEFGPPTSQAIGRSVLHEDEAGSVPYTRVAFGIPLYTYHQVPTFLKWNPGIKEGYRVGLPMGMCFRR